MSPYFESKSLFYNSVCYPTVLFVIHCKERIDQACLSKMILLCPLYNAVQATRTIGKFRLNLFYEIEYYVCYYHINTFHLYTPYYFISYYFLFIYTCRNQFLSRFSFHCQSGLSKQSLWLTSYHSRALR